jgi:peroxiredoxin
MNDELRPLPPGTQAPPFLLQHGAHESLALEDFLDQPVILVFYPGDWEPVSSEQLALYQEYLTAFIRLRATLVGISADSTWSHKAFARSLGLSFPLLADFHPRGAVARAYGVYVDGEETSARALFVLDGAGVIRWGHVYPTDLNPGVDGVLTALEGINASSS